MRILTQSLAEHSQSLHLNDWVLALCALKNTFPY